MLITDLQTSLALSAAGQGLNPTKTTLTTTTAAVQLHAQFITGVGTANRNERPKLKILMAISPFSINAADAPVQMRDQAFELDINPRQENTLPQHEVSPFIPSGGLYAYVWMDVPNFNAAPTLNLKLTEIN